MACIGDLPDELMDLILRYAASALEWPTTFYNSEQNVPPALKVLKSVRLVSKRWAALAFPLLFRQIMVTKTNVRQSFRRVDIAGTVEHLHVDAAVHPVPWQRFARALAQHSHRVRSVHVYGANGTNYITIASALKAVKGLSKLTLEFNPNANTNLNPNTPPGDSVEKILPSVTTLSVICSDRLHNVYSLLETFPALDDLEIVRWSGFMWSQWSRLITFLRPVSASLRTLRLRHHRHEDTRADNPQCLYFEFGQDCDFIESVPHLEHLYLDVDLLPFWLKRTFDLGWPRSLKVLTIEVWRRLDHEILTVPMFKTLKEQFDSRETWLKVLRLECSLGQASGFQPCRTCHGLGNQYRADFKKRGVKLEVKTPGVT